MRNYTQLSVCACANNRDVLILAIVKSNSLSFSMWVCLDGWGWGNCHWCPRNILFTYLPCSFVTAVENWISNAVIWQCSFVRVPLMSICNNDRRPFFIPSSLGNALYVHFKGLADNIVKNLVSPNVVSYCLGVFFLKN